MVQYLSGKSRVARPCLGSDKVFFLSNIEKSGSNMEKSGLAMRDYPAVSDILFSRASWTTLLTICFPDQDKG